MGSRCGSSGRRLVGRSRRAGTSCRPLHKAPLREAVLALLVGALTGCGGTIAGDWHMVQTVPNKDVFAIDDAQFRRDGTFAATITIEGKTAREAGTYHFNGFKLTLRPQAGGQRRYNATVKLSKLEISDSGRSVVLKKGKREPHGDSKTGEEAGNR